ncbi:hypothetical protein FF1_005361 [Malus domestica]
MNKDKRKKHYVLSIDQHKKKIKNKKNDYVEEENEAVTADSSSLSHSLGRFCIFVCIASQKYKMEPKRSPGFWIPSTQVIIMWTKSPDQHQGRAGKWDPERPSASGKRRWNPAGPISWKAISICDSL